MTEQTVPLGGTALAEPPAPPAAPAFDEVDSDGNRKKLLVVGAAVGVLVLLIAAFFLMKGGGSDTTDTAANIPAHRFAPSTTTHKTAKSTADKPVTLPKRFHGQVGHDPFKPLWTAPVKAEQQPTDQQQPTTQQPPTTSVPTTTVPPPTTSTTDGTTSAPAPTSDYKPVWVELVSLNGANSATFVVGYDNGKHFKTLRFDDVVAPGGATPTTFAKVFGLVSINGTSATVQFGDATPFDLHKGFANRHFV